MIAGTSSLDDITCPCGTLDLGPAWRTLHRVTCPHDPRHEPIEDNP